MDLAWTDCLSVGNAMIDADHKSLLGMANGVMYAIEVSDCSALSWMLERLESRLRNHFVHEENKILRGRSGSLLTGTSWRNVTL